jgi:hypothetical protein
MRSASSFVSTLPLQAQLPRFARTDRIHCPERKTRRTYNVFDGRFFPAMGDAAVIPTYQKLGPALASKFRTFDTCHRPPRAVRTPLLFSATAMPRRLVTPPFCKAVMTGSTVAAN